MVASYHHNLPGKVKIARKPVPVGAEFKTISDAETLIMLGLEINEGKEVNPTKKYCHDFGHTTATSLRLTEPYHCTGRTVVGDSWFGSVKTAVQLRMQGLFSICIVKTAHSNYPKKLLSDNIGSERGSFAGAVCVKTEGKSAIPLLAVMWKDRKEKQLIATCSTTVPGAPRISKSGRVIPRPKVCEEYFSSCAAIDRFNHVRHGGPSLMRTFIAKDSEGKDYERKDAWVDKVFISTIDFIEANAFLAYKHFGLEEDSSHFVFKLRLMDALMNNQVDSPRSSLVCDVHVCVKFPSNVKRRCFVCSRRFQRERRTRYYCAACGDRFPMCITGKGEQETGCMSNSSCHNPAYLQSL